MFRFTYPVVLWGGRGTANKYHWPVWGALKVFRPHWVCPCSWHVCFPHLHCSGSRLLYREWALSCMLFQFSGTPQKCRLGWTCVLCLPHPISSGNQEFDECPLPGCSVPYPLHSSSLSFCIRQLGAPCVSSGELVSSRDPPGRCQPSRFSGSLSLETGSLFSLW